jgi:hypothetical protein
MSLASAAGYLTTDLRVSATLVRSIVREGRRFMRSLIGITLALLVCGPSAGLAQFPKPPKATVVEQFNENCSAVELSFTAVKTMYTDAATVTLRMGQKSKLILLGALYEGSTWHTPGDIEWFCGSTPEESHCDSTATHVRVARAASGRATKFTCYRIESCTEGTMTLDTLDDRCGEDLLKVGGRRIAFLGKKENIPISAANLGNSGAVRWYCGDSAEQSKCPANTTLLTVERYDRDTRLFHIHCLRSGSVCEEYLDDYP